MLPRARFNRFSPLGKIRWAVLVKVCGNRCVECGADDVALTADHIIPVSKDGLNTIDNIQPLCKRCNCVKQTDVYDFRPPEWKKEYRAILRGLADE